MLKVYFLGSGDIAVPVLKQLAKTPEIQIAGVGSQPDRPAGRKKLLCPTPLAQAAAELGFAVQKPASVNDAEYLAGLRALSPDFILVVSFGQLLKAEILALPRLGCVNVHASLLPKYRGAAPIIQAIRNREPETAVSFMQMEKGLDTGGVYQVFRLVLDGSEYAGELELKLGELAGLHSCEVLENIAAGKLKPIPQNDAESTYCGKVAKEDGRIDFARHSAAEISAMVRAYTPWPGAWAEYELNGKLNTVTFNRIEIVENPPEIPDPGCTAGGRKRLLTGAAGGTVFEVKELTPSGGKRLDAAGFLNGARGAEIRFR